MKQYESKQQQILLPAEQIFKLISDFNNLTPVVADKVEEWCVDGEGGDSCSFKAKGFKIRLKIAEKIECKHVKVVPDGDGAAPMDFGFWIQLHSVSESDTRFRLVLKAELNTMMNMMIGGKIQGAIDQVAEQVAYAFASKRA
ncbi:MAG: polyketide cyclase [Rikenellaceae bacterium]